MQESSLGVSATPLRFVDACIITSVDNTSLLLTHALRSSTNRGKLLVSDLIAVNLDLR